MDIPTLTKEMIFSVTIVLVGAQAFTIFLYVPYLILKNIVEKKTVPSVEWIKEQIFAHSLIVFIGVLLSGFFSILIIFLFYVRT